MSVITVVNINKPPGDAWPTPALPILPHDTFHSARCKADYSPDIVLSRTMININPYQGHPSLNHISQTANTPASSRSAWTLGPYTNHLVGAKTLAGISGKQTSLSLRKASLELSIAYHRGLKARPFKKKCTTRVGIPIHARISWLIERS